MKKFILAITAICIMTLLVVLNYLLWDNINKENEINALLMYKESVNLNIESLQNENLELRNENSEHVSTITRQTVRINNYENTISSLNKELENANSKIEDRDIVIGFLKKIMNTQMFTDILDAWVTSIGLHQRDNKKLLDTLIHLRDLGNTLIVVEHDEETMYYADHIIDIGPGAGEHGGRIVCEGPIEVIKQCEESYTGQYLSGKRKIEIPEKRRTPNGKYLEVINASENNLKNLNVKIPIGLFTCVTGVSGSGKSTLVNKIIYQSLATLLNGAKLKAGKHDMIKGIGYLDKVINIDQSPIGRTPRSNPATYTGVFDLIRDLFAQTVEAKVRGYSKGRFSFNVSGGRCEACKGDGIVKIEMHFLADVYVPCEVCKGKRYNRETLEVKYKGKNIYDVLNMTVEDAYEFFENQSRIQNKLKTLMDVGLGYIRLGQSSTTLSGGEAQRIKLATELSKIATGKTLYILDEPTTGLHIHDIHRLINILQQLTDGGNTVLVIEHNLDVIKTCDYIIDLGPEGGDEGGYIVAEGSPEEVANVEESYTGQFLKKILEKKEFLRP
jgi:excinuclease ABC subunit A